jgi:protein TonB
VPAAYEPYLRALRERVQARAEYPWAARRRRLEGTVELELRLDGQGGLTGVAVVEAGAAEPLREAALQAVRAAAPFPFPAGVPARPLVIRLPVVFALR